MPRATLKPATVPVGVEQIPRSGAGKYGRRCIAKSPWSPPRRRAVAVRRGLRFLICRWLRASQQLEAERPLPLRVRLVRATRSTVSLYFSSVGSADRHVRCARASSHGTWSQHAKSHCLLSIWELLPYFRKQTRHPRWSTLSSSPPFLL